jgi:hypothetical protein
VAVKAVVDPVVTLLPLGLQDAIAAMGSHQDAAKDYRRAAVRAATRRSAIVDAIVALLATLGLYQAIPTARNPAIGCTPAVLALVDAVVALFAVLGLYRAIAAVGMRG